MSDSTGAGSGVDSDSTGAGSGVDSDSTGAGSTVDSDSTGVGSSSYASHSPIFFSFFYSFFARHLPNFVSLGFVPSASNFKPHLYSRWKYFFSSLTTNLFVHGLSPIS